jgi:hypothetical protein
MDRVTALGSTYFAVGKNAAGSAVWSSTDGLTWTVSTTSRNATEFKFVAADGKRVVAFGFDDSNTLVILVGRPASG